MVPAQAKPRPRSRWNPLAPLQALAQNRALSIRVKQRAAELGAAAGTKDLFGSGGSGGSTSSSGGGPEPAAGSEPAQQAAPSAHGLGQYSLQEVSPARRLLAGGTPPQLAWVPLRVALQLLQLLPQHFLVLQGPPQPASPPQQPKRQPRPGQKPAPQPQQQGHQQQGAGARQGQAWRWPWGGAAREPPAYHTVTSPQGLEVHIVPVRWCLLLLRVRLALPPARLPAVCCCCGLQPSRVGMRGACSPVPLISASHTAGAERAPGHP